MTKKVLITGGAVHASLDSNKIVSNRTRGIWAREFANYCSEKGYEVTLILPEIGFRKSDYSDKYRVILHTGFWDYKEQCIDLARSHDVAVMAAAVTNWIPEKPFVGKMPTNVNRMTVDFILAPRVIDEMRKVNPNLTLVGCKLTVGADRAGMLELAMKTQRSSKAHVIVANDLKSGLKTKTLCYPDGCQQVFENDFPRLFKTLVDLFEDQHYRTINLALHDTSKVYEEDETAKNLMAEVLNKYRSQFAKSYAGYQAYFGSVAVPIHIPGRIDGMMWMTPREKLGISVEDIVLVVGVDNEKRNVLVAGDRKATMNAPLLYRVALAYNAQFVLHLHEMMDGVPTLPYAPPGTIRDSMRELPGPAFNIEGHGFVAAFRDGYVLK